MIACPSLLSSPHCSKKAGLEPRLGFPGEKENSLKTDDYGRDLSSVQTLLTKQVSRGPSVA